MLREPARMMLLYNISMYINCFQPFASALYACLYIIVEAFACIQSEE